MNDELRALICRVAEALGDRSTDAIELVYGSINGEFGWTCELKPLTKKHGRGRRVVRYAECTFGDTPVAAVDEMLLKIADLKEPEVAAKRRKDEATISLLEEMKAKGELTEEQFNSAVGRVR